MTIARNWLLEVDAGGKLLRYANQSVTVTDERGRSLYFAGGLGPIAATWDDQLDRIGVEIHDPGVDFPALIAAGMLVEQRPAKLWLLADDQTELSAGLYVLAGEARDPEWLDPRAPGRLVLSLVASSALTDGRALYPPPWSVAEPETFGASGSISLDQTIRGAVYPTVFGYPGSGDDSETLAFAGSPALLVRNNVAGTSEFMIARGKVDAANVILWDMDGSEYTTDNQVGTQSLAVSSDTDDLGDTFAKVDDSGGGPSGISARSGHEYWVGWNNDAADGGGTIDDDGGGVLRGLGDVIAWLLRRALDSRGNLIADIPSQLGQAEDLNTYQLDTFINERIDPVEWIEANLVEPFLLRRVETGAGLFYRRRNYRATRREAVAWYSVERGELAPTGPLRYADRPIANVFDYDYALNGVTGYPYKHRRLQGEYGRLGPGYTTATDDRVIGSPVCAISEARYGRREATPVTLVHTWSTSTVIEVLRQRVAREALPLLRRDYEGRDLDQRHRPGDVIVVDDDAAGLSARVALIESIELGGRLNPVSVTFLPERR